MYPIVCTIYGSVAIQSYGACLVAGIFTCLILLIHDPLRKELVSTDQLFDIMGKSTLVGIAGGHLLFVLAEKNLSLAEIILPWNGLSVMGAVIAVILFLMLYLPQQNIAPIPLLDRAAVYAPLMHCFGRIGCFLAGCCPGLSATIPWAITYQNESCYAPLGIPLHPVQLYSAALQLLIFLWLYFFLQKKSSLSGTLLSSYVMLLSAERFATDFFRYDHGHSVIEIAGLKLPGVGQLGLYQIICLGLFLASLSWYMLLRRRKKREPVHEPV